MWDEILIVLILTSFSGQIGENIENTAFEENIIVSREFSIINSTINGNITIKNDSKFLARNCTFSKGKISIESSSVIIEDCEVKVPMIFYGNSRAKFMNNSVFSHILCKDNSSPLISNNLFFSKGGEVIDCYDSAHPAIENNEFCGNLWCINTWDVETNALISGNNFHNNYGCINCRSSAIIENNRFEDSVIGVVCHNVDHGKARSGVIKPIIKNNSFSYTDAITCSKIGRVEPELINNTFIHCINSELNEKGQIYLHIILTSISYFDPLATFTTIIRNFC